VVSAPLRWDEIADADPKDFTIATMPARYAEVGDLHADIDDHPYRLDELLEWADRDERDNKTVSDVIGSDAMGADGLEPPDVD
jgi:DNA primase